MKPSEFCEVSYAVRDHVAIVTLDRPQRRNAWTGRMSVEYRWALAAADADPDVGAIVVTGAGGTFSVGADSEILTEMDQAGGTYERAALELPPYPADAPPGLRHNHTYPLSLATPVIAALNGACAGAGFVIACYADIRLAADDAKITPSFAGLGLPAEYGIAWILPRIVGLQNAAEILMTNAVMSGPEAVELGFVRRSWAAGEFADRVHDYAGAIAAHSSPASLAILKRQLYVDAAGDLDEAYRRAVTDMNRMVGEPDFSEGLRALRQRRRPQFRPEPGGEHR